MEKTLVIQTDDKEIEITVKASMSALQLYRAEFNADLIRDLNEIYNKLHPDPFADAIKKLNINPEKTSQEELANLILSNVDYSVYDNENAILDGDAQIKAYQIIWTMAKAAGNGTKRFDLWCNDFEFLPVNAIIDRCYEIWKTANTGIVQLKN